MPQPITATSWVTLDRLSIRQRARIVSVEGGDAMAMRLSEMGLQSGESIEVLGAAPWGDPRAYLVRGYRLALRSSEARRVIIDREPLA